MNGKELLEGMSYVDDRFVDEAENLTIRKRSAAPLIRWASLAACLCLIVFSAYSLNQGINRDPTEGMIEGSAAGEVYPGEGIEAEMQHESSVVAPEDGPTGEAQSLFLRVEGMTEDGFVGTVAEPADTDIFEIGMELNVVLEDSTRTEISAASEESADAKMNYTEGSLVHVQFISYDEQTGTIVVSILGVVDEPVTD